MFLITFFVFYLDDMFVILFCGLIFLLCINKYEI